jgi:hypothetical protein
MVTLVARQYVAMAALASFVQRTEASRSSEAEAAGSRHQVQERKPNG